MHDFNINKVNIKEVVTTMKTYVCMGGFPSGVDDFAHNLCSRFISD